MSDDLVKRHVEQLRLTGGDLADLCRPLADAIEALTAERDEAWAYMSALQGDLYDAIMIKAERDRLREALTELLQVFDGVPMLGIEASRRGEAARAALKGETT